MELDLCSSRHLTPPHYSNLTYGKLMCHVCHDGVVCTLYTTRHSDKREAKCKSSPGLKKYEYFGFDSFTLFDAAFCTAYHRIKRTAFRFIFKVQRERYAHPRTVRSAQTVRAVYCMYRTRPPRLARIRRNTVFMIHEPQPALLLLAQLRSALRRLPPQLPAPLLPPLPAVRRPQRPACREPLRSAA